MLIRIILLMMLPAFLVGCGAGMPSNDAVRKVFEEEHPTSSVLSVGVGEGDGFAAYFHIRYRRPEDSRIHEDVWQYLNEGKGEWVLSYKESLPSPRQ